MKEGKTESEKDMFFLIVPESAVVERQSSVVINQLNNNQSTPVSYAVAEKNTSASVLAIGYLSPKILPLQ